MSKDRPKTGTDGVALPILRRNATRGYGPAWCA
jgi:hypothetical protein